LLWSDVAETRAVQSVLCKLLCCRYSVKLYTIFGTTFVGMLPITMAWLWLLNGGNSHSDAWLTRNWTVKQIKFTVSYISRKQTNFIILAVLRRSM